MVFLKKWPRNHTQFLLHFLMYIDVLMLCRKFELISDKKFLSSEKYYRMLDSPWK